MALPPIDRTHDSDWRARLKYHASCSRFPCPSESFNVSASNDVYAEAQTPSPSRGRIQLPPLKALTPSRKHRVSDANRNAEDAEDVEARFWSQTTNSESDPRISALSAEVDLKNILNKDHTKDEKPEKKWYRIREIKANLVDINCQRISKILNEGAIALDKAMLVPLLCRNLMEAPDSVFDFLRNPLLQFQSLLEDFNAKTDGSLRADYMALDGGLKKSVANTTIRTIEGNIKCKLRKIYRSLETLDAREDADEMKDFVESLQSHKPVAVQKLHRQFDRFREALQLRLGRTQRQLVQQADEIHQSTRRRNEQLSKIALLQGRLTNHAQKTKELCDVLDKKIEKVANDAMDVKKKSTAQIKLRNGIYNEVNDECANSKKKVAKLEEQKREAGNVLTAIIDGHVAEETKLREKKYKMETEKDNWIAKYDKDMGNLQNQFDLIWVDYSAQKKILDALEAKFAVVEITYNEIVATRAAEEEERNRARRELLAMNTSASVIQAFWRTRAVLKRLQAKSKRKKK